MMYTILILIFVLAFSILVFSFTLHSKNHLLRAKISNMEDIIESMNRSIEFAKVHIANISRRNREALTGARVLIKSNEKEPIRSGIIMRFEDVSMAKNPMPIVKFDDDPEKEYLCFAAVIPYNEKILKEIESLSLNEQWERMKNISLYWE